MSVLHLFPNRGQIVEKINTDYGKDFLEYTFDPILIENISAFSEKGEQLLTSGLKKSPFASGSQVEVITKSGKALSGKLIERNADSVRLLLTTEQDRNVPVICKYLDIYDEVSGPSLIINNKPGNKNVFIINDTSKINWIPTYSLFVKDNNLMNFTFGANVSSEESSRQYPISQIYFHTNPTVERNKRYYSAPRMAAQSLAPQSLSSGDNLSIQQDLSYVVILDTDLHRLYNVPIKEFSQLDNFREVYVINLIHQNTQVMRSYIFDETTYFPDGTVTILDDQFNIVSKGSISNYLDEKTVSVISDPEIQATIEVITQESSDKPVASTDKTVSSVDKTEPDKSGLFANPYLTKDSISSKTLQDIFTISLVNTKDKKVTVRLIYNSEGLVKKIIPDTTDRRPGLLIWDIELEPKSTKKIDGGIKYTIISYN